MNELLTDTIQVKSLSSYSLHPTFYPVHHPPNYHTDKTKFDYLNLKPPKSTSQTLTLISPSLSAIKQQKYPVDYNAQLYTS